LKEHLYRRHAPFPNECLRCNDRFETNAELSNHLRNNANPCETQTRANHGDEARFTPDQERRLRARKKHSPKTEEEKWTEVFRVLFPHENRIPSPYYNYDHHDMPPSPESVEMFRERLLSSFRLEIGKIAYLSEDNIKEIVATYRKSQEDVWGQWQAERPSYPVCDYTTSGESSSSRPTISFNEDEVNEEANELWDGDWTLIGLGSWSGVDQN
jgi:hypothetical protein